MTPEDMDKELDRLQGELSLLIVTIRSEITHIGLLRHLIRDEVIGHG